MSTVTINGHMEFSVPDSKMELVKALLFEVASGAQNTPPEPPRPNVVKEARR